MSDGLERIDKWTRFDMWAERAHQAAQNAVEAETKRGQLNDCCTGGVCDAYSRAADIYRDLAQASRPDTTAPLPDQPAVITVT